MSSIQQISTDLFIKKIQERFRILDIRDKAWIKRPPEYFEKKLNVEFSEKCDDFDYLEEGLFSFKEKLFFRLSRYRNQPDQNMTTIEMPKDYSQEEMDSVLEELQKACDLEPDEIVAL